jgi:hypothetical protein
MVRLVSTVLAIALVSVSASHLKNQFAISGPTHEFQEQADANDEDESPPTSVLTLEYIVSDYMTPELVEVVLYDWDCVPATGENEGKDNQATKEWLPIETVLRLANNPNDNGTQGDGQLNRTYFLDLQLSPDVRTLTKFRIPPEPNRLLGLLNVFSKQKQPLELVFCLRFDVYHLPKAQKGMQVSFFQTNMRLTIGSGNSTTSTSDDDDSINIITKVSVEKLEPVGIMIRLPGAEEDDTVLSRRNRKRRIPPNSKTKSIIPSQKPTMPRQKRNYSKPVSRLIGVNGGKYLIGRIWLGTLPLCAVVRRKTSSSFQPRTGIIGPTNTIVTGIIIMQISNLFKSFRLF